MEPRNAYLPMSDQNDVPAPNVDLTDRVNPAADSAWGVDRRESTVGAVLDAVVVLVGVADGVPVGVGAVVGVPEGVGVGVSEGVGDGVSACP